MAKVMVSIQDELLRKIDRAAHAQGASRSAFLAAAARRHLAQTGEESVTAAVASLEKIFTAPPFIDAAALVRADRDARDRHDRQRVSEC